MIKVHILTTCSECNGESYLPIGEVADYQGRKYTKYHPCPRCEGTGESDRWISLMDFADLLVQTSCSHKHTSSHGGMHFDAGVVWDDIRVMCDDCGANLEEEVLMENSR